MVAVYHDVPILDKSKQFAFITSIFFCLPTMYYVVDVDLVYKNWAYILCFVYVFFFSMCCTTKLLNYLFSLNVKFVKLIFSYALQCFFELLFSLRILSDSIYTSSYTLRTIDQTKRNFVMLDVQNRNTEII